MESDNEEIWKNKNIKNMENFYNNIKKYNFKVIPYNYLYVQNNSLDIEKLYENINYKCMLEDACFNLYEIKNLISSKNYIDHLLNFHNITFNKNDNYIEKINKYKNHSQKYHNACNIITNDSEDKLTKHLNFLTKYNYFLGTIITDVKYKHKNNNIYCSYIGIFGLKLKYIIDEDEKKNIKKYIENKDTIIIKRLIFLFNNIKTIHIKDNKVCTSEEKTDFDKINYV